MKRRQPSAPATGQTLCAAALRLPEAREGVACEGTALEKRTVKVRDKAFLFLAATDAMLKLRESLAEATRLASEEPARYKVGAHGWVTVTFGDGEPPPADMLARWVEESYRLLAPVRLAADVSRGPVLPAEPAEGRKARSPTARRGKGA